MKTEDVYRKVGALDALQCVNALESFIHDNYYKIVNLAGNYESIRDCMSDILARGLDEVENIREMIHEAELAERSEKDCLWTDGCD